MMHGYISGRSLLAAPFRHNSFIGQGGPRLRTPTPVGPFTGKTAACSTPETGAAGSYGNPNVFTYNSCAHPELSRPGRLLVSYNVNSLEPDDLYRDVSIYRPRFIDVDIVARKVQQS